MAYPKIKLTSEVIEYLKTKKKRALTFKVNLTGGCCGSIEVEEILLQAPRKSERFFTENIDDIDVYVSKTIRFSEDTLTFDLHKGFLGKSIQVSGIQKLNQI